MRVLIADDSATQRLILKSIIQNFYEDVTVEEAGDGSKAIEMMQANDYKLVFTDINMEPMSGLEFVEKTKENHPHTIYTFITSHLTDTMKEQTRKLGVDNYLTKPLTPEKVQGLLKEFEL